MIPVPVVGALVGGFAGKLVASALESTMDKRSARLVARLNDVQTRELALLDADYRALVHRLDHYFGNLQRIGQVAFDVSVNTALRLTASAEYARAVGVDPRTIINTTDELDAFMME